jgi:hypothetical protein
MGDPVKIRTGMVSIPAVHFSRKPVILFELQYLKESCAGYLGDPFQKNHFHRF